MAATNEYDYPLSIMYLPVIIAMAVSMVSRKCCAVVGMKC